MQPLLSYFTAERHAGLLCAVLGVVSLAMAGWLWRGAHSFRAMLYPLALIGLVQLAVGVTLLVRTGPQVAALERDLAAEPVTARATEAARMEKVARSFRLIEALEAVLIVGGLAAALLLSSRPALVGVAMGLMLEASVMLVFDVFAEHRARVYHAWLRDGP